MLTYKAKEKKQKFEISVMMTAADPLTSVSNGFPFVVDFFLLLHSIEKILVLKNKKLQMLTGYFIFLSSYFAISRYFFHLSLSA